MSSGKKNYSLDLLSCALIGAVSFLWVLWLIPSVQWPGRILTNLLTVTAQLFGFGGVIFAVLYHVQRSMLAEHHRKLREISKEIIEDMNKPIFEQFSKTSQEILREHGPHAEALHKGADIYMAGRRQFSLAFIALGISLVLQLIQENGIEKVEQMHLYGIAGNGLLISTEIALIAVGVSGFIYAMVRSMDLPLGTGSESNDS